MDHYILRGHEVVKVSLFQWADFFENDDRIVKQETLPNGNFVSTVFLGIDHAFNGGPPLIFETMVFGGPGVRDCERCSTWEEAESQHQLLVIKYSRVEGEIQLEDHSNVLLLK